MGKNLSGWREGKNRACQGGEKKKNRPCQGEEIEKETMLWWRVGKKQTFSGWRVGKKQTLSGWREEKKQTLSGWGDRKRDHAVVERGEKTDLVGGGGGEQTMSGWREGKKQTLSGWREGPVGLSRTVLSLSRTVREFSDICNVINIKLHMMMVLMSCTQLYSFLRLGFFVVTYSGH